MQENKVLNIFVVEDSLIMSNSIVKHIEKEFENKVRTIQFNTVKEVMAYDKAFPDIMLLDHILQESNGIDSIPALLEAFKGVKIAIISGQNDVDVFKTAYSHGAMEYIRKDALLFHEISDFIKGQLYSSY